MAGARNAWALAGSWLRARHVDCAVSEGRGRDRHTWPSSGSGMRPSAATLSRKLRIQALRRNSITPLFMPAHVQGA